MKKFTFSSVFHAACFKNLRDDKHHVICDHIVRLPDYYIVCILETGKN